MGDSSLDHEGPLEQEMVTHSNILAWRVPWTEEPGELQSMGCKESDTTGHTHKYTHRHTHTLCSGVRIHNGEKMVSLESGDGKVGQPHVYTKGQNTLTPHTNINSKWHKDLNTKYDTLKLIKENIGKTFSDINYTSIFLGQSPKSIKIKVKINKQDLIKLKSFAQQKKM